jgi:hypothetical protein
MACNRDIFTFLPLQRNTVQLKKTKRSCTNCIRSSLLSFCPTSVAALFLVEIWKWLTYARIRSVRVSTMQQLTASYETRLISNAPATLQISKSKLWQNYSNCNKLTTYSILFKGHKSMVPSSDNYSTRVGL